MRDMLTLIYERLIENPVIKTEVTKKRIKYYEYPETGDIGKPFIVISPLGVSSPVAYASDNEVSLQFSCQIDVQGTNRMLVKKIQRAVKETMFEFGYAQLPEGLDTYFAETKRFLDARRYRKNTNIYDTDY